ncbi:hypothetical protein O6P43_014938 [Quillaja saponaria]|uniref:Uncharacterized protein n=1 Tax=Quillaja saponaria TaxID=32244 RepID=A0AAD7PSH3_QUISA|nr:hypothetical protein O6P43_014938 [Quillaja saponaria]
MSSCKATIPTKINNVSAPSCLATFPMKETDGTAAGSNEGTGHWQQRGQLCGCACKSTRDRGHMEQLWTGNLRLCACHKTKVERKVIDVQIQ